MIKVTLIEELIIIPWEILKVFPQISPTGCIVVPQTPLPGRIQRSNKSNMTGYRNKIVFRGVRWRGMFNNISRMLFCSTMRPGIREGGWKNDVGHPWRKRNAIGGSRQFIVVYETPGTSTWFLYSFKGDVFCACKQSSDGSHAYLKLTEVARQVCGGIPVHVHATCQAA